MSKCDEEFPLYEWGVLETASNIVCSISGTGDPIDLRKAVDWLEPRVTHHWQPYKSDKFARYQWAVRELAMAAVSLAKDALVPATKG